MTDSPAPGRHRSRRARRRRRRGLIGPVVSSLSVLVAIAPVVWLMTKQDGSTLAQDGPTEVLNVAEDNSGPAAVESVPTPAPRPGKPQVTVTATVPGGTTTTIGPTGTPVLGLAESSTGTPTGGPATVTATTPGVKTVTVTPSQPSGRPSTAGRVTPRPRPSEPTATRTTPTSRPTPESSPEPPATGGGTSEIEREVLELTNEARRRQGCRALRLDDSLVEAAGRHASDMVRRHYLDHTNPDGEGPGDRMSEAGFEGSGWGENIAAGYDSARRVFAAWMDSDGHRANILNCRFNRIGIGYDPGRVKPDWGPGSWVQDFGRVG